MAASSSSSSSYEVFLSFRGKDTRKTFTSHLFARLKEHGLNVFHDTMLKRGENISSLLQAIDGSKLSIIVFSKNYADSKWCLDELVKIVECHHRSSDPQIILPVFYDVEPTDVKNQMGHYKAAFENHEKKRTVEQVRDWKAALNEVGNLSGLHLQNDSNGDEADFIRRIVKQIKDRLYQSYLNVAYDHPVGITHYVENLKGLLSLETNDIHIVVICGVGGIGKTTIAKAFFNNYSRLLDGSCFLANVRAAAARPDDVGMITLQETLIANMIKENVPKIYSCDQGMEVIKDRLWRQRRRVLVVLDDVDNVEQLRKLAIDRKFLHQGSVVIITTRDRSCLASLDVKFYEPEPLRPSDSLKLFSWHAFRNDCPKAGYNEISKKVVKYAGGVPLVLETLGPYMRDSGTIEDWQRALERLRIIPHDDVQEKLKLSFDSLGTKEKKLFLDIACFFVGTDKELMLQVLDEKAPEYYPLFEFKVLYNKCLVKIRHGELYMHDMVRDMGREIVRQESLDDPGRRSRLCHPHDVLSVLKDCSGTEAIQSIFLEVSNLYEESIEMMAFAKMTKLRMVHFSNIKWHGTYSNMKFFEKLKWLSWYSFPFIRLPYKLNLRNLVALDLQNSKLKQLWVGTKSLDKLRFLNVSNSHFLSSTPDFSGVINLEKLLLRDCTHLREIHHSIGCLHKLIVLDLTNCESLIKVPLSFFQLKSLKDLNFSGCSKLFKPTQSEVSVYALWNWFSSRLSWEPQPEILQPRCLLTRFSQGQNCLTRLNLESCNLSCLPTGIENLSSLVHLNLSGNKFASLPANIKYLQRLKMLVVQNCVELKTITDLPSGILLLNAEFCPLLETVEFASGWSRQPSLYVSETAKLIDNLFTRKEHALSNLTLFVDADGHFERRMGRLPHWLSYQAEGPFIYFVVPQHPGRRIKGWIVAFPLGIPFNEFVIVNVYNITKDMYSVFACYTGIPDLWMGYVELSKYGIVADGGDEIEIVFLLLASRFRYVRNMTCRRCGLYLVYDDDDDDDDEDEVGNEQIIPIQYSSQTRLAMDMDVEVDAMEHVSQMMRARLEHIKYVLDHFSWYYMDMLVKELADGGGGGIHYSREHTQIYHVIANEYYNEQVRTAGFFRGYRLHM